jgi:hypothetical protein
MDVRTLALPFGTRKSVQFQFLRLRKQNVVLIVKLSPFLKERLFGLSNPQGNHGESIKEAHFHVDNTPVSQKHLSPT